MMPRTLKVTKLSDEFGQYMIELKCGACLHRREVYPKSLAGVCGWEALLADVSRRMRCSKCGARQCAARPIEMVKPRGGRAAH